MRRVCSILCNRRYGFCLHSVCSSPRLLGSVPSFSCGSSTVFQGGEPVTGCRESKMVVHDTRRLLRLVNVETMKKRLRSIDEACIPYSHILRLSQTMGIAASDLEAEEFVKALDAAGVVFIFRGKVYLHPQQVADLVANAFPLPLPSENDLHFQQLQRLRRKREEIDKAAQRKVRSVLWSGLGVLTIQTALFIRLTFWELSWDIMEPITFFVTSGGFIVCYAYFLITSREPTYEDFAKSVFHAEHQKLIERKHFNSKKLNELERQSLEGRS
eukprot:c24241_g1_i1 orf=320-1132(+)